MRKNLRLSSFALHIIALVTMTLDHLANFLYGNGIYANMTFYLALRIIGRTAFVLYAFFLVHGVIHTKHFGKYLGRLSGLAFIIFISDIILSSFSISTFEGNIFFTLLAGALAIYYFDRKLYKHVYLFIPAIYIIVIDLLNIFDVGVAQSYFTAMYGTYGLVVIFGFYLALFLAKKVNIQVSERSGITVDTLVNSGEYQFLENIFSVGSLFIVTVIYFVLSLVWRESDLLNQSIQSYALLAGIPIFLYNGKRGYTAKWWKIFSYAYYPAHLLIFAIITLLISS